MIYGRQSLRNEDERNSVKMLTFLFHERTLCYGFSKFFDKWEERVQAGNTEYTADSHPKSTKPRQGNDMNVNSYKNTEDTQKQTHIY